MRGAGWGVPPLARPLSPLGDSMPPMAPEASRRDHKTLRRSPAEFTPALRRRRYRKRRPSSSAGLCTLLRPACWITGHAARGILSELAGCSGPKETYEPTGDLRGLTHQRHWLCTAAMVLMPGLTPIKVLV